MLRVPFFYFLPRSREAQKAETAGSRKKGSIFMSNQTNQETRQWGSRFGYLMVAAGAAIGLGNIWTNNTCFLSMTSLP